MAKATLDRIDQKLDDLKETVVSLIASVDKQNGRIGKLERWRAYAIGIATAASVILGRIFH